MYWLQFQTRVRKTAKNSPRTQSVKCIILKAMVKSYHECSFAVGVDEIFSGPL